MELLILVTVAPLDPEIENLSLSINQYLRFRAVGRGERSEPSRLSEQIKDCLSKKCEESFDRFKSAVSLQWSIKPKVERIIRIFKRVINVVCRRGKL